MLDVEDVTVLGWSMGASILWSYIELFGNHRISGLICVDQSPAQYTGPDWQWGQKGCYDVEMFIPNIKLPTLVCVARNSNVFDWHGSAWVGENIPGAKMVFFENSGHMLFWEEPDKFNQTVAEFVKNH